MIKEPRSVWSGISFVLFLGAAAFCLLAVLATFLKEDMSPNDRHLVLSFLALFLLAALLLIPVVLCGFFLWEGIQVIRREGLRPGNLLAAGAGLLLLVYFFGLPFFFCRPESRQALFGLTFIFLAGTWYICLLSAYTLSALLNLLHVRQKRKLDYIVVLGCGLAGTEVTHLLAGRIARGMALQQKNPGAVLLLSGGQGPGEDLPEGEAMAAWALEHGADPALVLVENQSKNTRENLQFSRALMQKKKPRIAIVTTGYHVFRSLLLAKELGIPCIGFGAKTKWYFTVNALIREFIGYLAMHWKGQALILGIFGFISALLA